MHSTRGRSRLVLPAPEAQSKCDRFLRALHRSRFSGGPRVQTWAKRRALGCEKFQLGPAWLSLSKTGLPFGPSMYCYFLNDRRAVTT